MNEWMSKQQIHDGIQLEIHKTSPAKSVMFHLSS